MKKTSVLVVSDNEELIKYILGLMQEKEFDSFSEIEIMYSAVNRNPDRLVKMGLHQVDVKAQESSLIEKYDLIISAHCKQIFPPGLVNSVTCVNIHPGLNPYNRGWYPQIFSIINKKPIGATIHVMDEQIDNGEIIVKKEVSSYESDTSKDLYERVIEAEKKLLETHLEKIIKGDFGSKEVTSAGNYNSPADFLNLCELNLSSAGTLREHIDLLRALSHGDHNNAYFFDETGTKVYVRMTLERDCGKS
jgi:methionyl-tRNA formyltransferase